MVYSHESNMHQNVQTFILEVNGTRVGAPLEVLPHNTTI